MKRILTTCTCLTALTTAALAETPRNAIVNTHPSQGEVTAVADATAQLLVHDDGLFVSLDTENLTPDHVHTLWLVVINNPAGCFDAAAVEAQQKVNAEDCNSSDVLLRTDDVAADVGYAGGVIVGEDGKASFAFHQEEGALSGAWFGTGLGDASAAEVHLVVNDHGPLIAGRERAMISSYRDGCKDDSIPGPMPAAARADGAPGPNVCRLVQTAVFKLPEQSS
ncbi:hypothetical protein [Yoonia sp. SS1-5]|uniref:Uncharacterized protein n=1 Tax=Yoonia rhodophyticola TaxID=3137370 RepID=A0AAN0NK03_9RHOB